MNVPAPTLILASASPRRRELLQGLGLPFAVVVADVVEHEDAAADPRALVAHNAALKADWVAARHPDAVVLGADTTVCLEGMVLNKPGDVREARGMLRLLSGRTHLVVSGLALRRPSAGLWLDDIVESRVTFKPLTETIISDYLKKVNTLDKAGGYGIQEHGEMLVAGYEGSLTNIIGLPLEETKHILTNAGLLR